MTQFTDMNIFFHRCLQIENGQIFVKSSKKRAMRSISVEITKISNVFVHLMLFHSRVTDLNFFGF